MKTALYERHCALGAKISPFAGWEMPIQYKGILEEHHAVRRAAGLFDISHMGRILVKGEDAEALLDYLSANSISNKPDGSVTYTIWCHETGGSVDDVMIYRHHAKSFSVIVNASNRQKDLDHLKNYASPYRVSIQDCFEEQGILALQGPLAQEILSPFIQEISSLKPMHFLEKEDLVVSRTGYTGAGGFELFIPNKDIIKWWDQLLQQGQPQGLLPVGLGARDTLRLEMGFALYGHELSDTIAPSESVSAWTIKWQKEDFLGKKALDALEHSPNKRRPYGMMLLDRGIAREGYSILKGEEKIGTVTSGTFSPTLNQAIAIILTKVPLQVDDLVTVQIRQAFCRAKIVQLPFVRKSK